MKTVKALRGLIALALGIAATSLWAAPDIRLATTTSTEASGLLAVILPQFEARLWFGLFTTQKTPKPVVDKLHQAIVEILAMPDVRETILKQGIEVVSSSPAELGRFVTDEIARWTPIIKAAGITAD